MKVCRITKLKVSDVRLDGIVIDVLKATNWLSKIVFESKELNSNRLHRAHYATIRERGVKSQVVASLIKNVTAAYQSQKTREKWFLSKFKQPVIPIVYGHDFTRTKKGPKLWGQPLIIDDPRPLPDHWLSSKLKRIGKTWYLLLCHEVEIPEPKAEGCLVGVDSGIKRMLTATNSANSQTLFFHGGVLNHQRCCIRRTRARVQAVGSRSARRLLCRLARREAAVTGHLLHVASKALVAYAVKVGAQRIVMEDLSNVRDASLRKGKDLRSKVHRWPYADLQFKVAYKAVHAGIAFELVDPRNTSRGCPRCGHVAASNRNGLSFHCGRCNHHADADRNASENIRARSIASEQCSEAMGNRKFPQSSEPSEIASGPIDSSTARLPV